MNSYHGHPIGTSLEPAVCCIYSVKQVYYEASAGNNIRQMSPIAMQMHNVISRDEDADHPKSVSSTHSSKSYGTSFQTTEESELVNIEHSHWPVDKDHIQPQDAPARVMYNCDAGPHSSDDMLKVFTSHNGRHSSMHHAGIVLFYSSIDDIVHLISCHCIIFVDVACRVGITVKLTVCFVSGTTERGWIKPIPVAVVTQKYTLPLSVTHTC